MSAGEFYLDRARANDHGTVTPERSRSDFNSRSRWESISSACFSGRTSRRSSVRDEMQTLDEFHRKQRVIRYMQEERERAERTKMLREEHDAWVGFHADERAERLKFMTEQEIAEFLQREAEEAVREKDAAEAAFQRAAEDAARRRQSFSDVRKKEEESAIARKKSEIEAEEARRSAQREAAQKNEALVQAEQARRMSLELRQREEDLIAKCRRLEYNLREAELATAAAKKAQLTAEEDLNIERKRNAKERGTSAVASKQSADLQKRNDELQKRVDDLDARIQGLEGERERIVSKCNEKDGIIKNLNDHSEAADCEVEALRHRLAILEAKPANGLLKGSEDLEKERSARVAAQRRCSELERALADAEKQRKSPSGDISRSHFLSGEQRNIPPSLMETQDLRAELANQHKRREAAEQAAAQARIELQRERERAKKAVLSPSVPTAPDTAKKISDLEKAVEIMKRDKARDVEATQLVRNELQATREDLKRETAARAKFEELAAQAVSKGDYVPREELVKTQNDLSEAQKKLRRSEVNAKAARDHANKEVQELKAWCARLREESDRQMRENLMTPRLVRKDPKALQVARPVSKPALDQALEIEHLKAQVQELQATLKDSDSRAAPKEVTSLRDNEERLPLQDNLKRENESLAQQRMNDDVALKDAKQQTDGQPLKVAQLQQNDLSGEQPRLDAEHATRALPEGNVQGLQAVSDAEREARRAANEPVESARPTSARSGERLREAEDPSNASGRNSQLKKEKAMCGC